ncbi:hypothetical protein AVEN_11127-1 [Araneus ventricosus]|uniref:Uncharacterized protein n=1 Tax=Araneus ventricosus TaxID=182803 RepID=A0A4Y2JIM5_ARAVE|nr:hypothetical protein AVEN_11127-1 [Araneus ventricosus]
MDGASLSSGFGEMKGLADDEAQIEREKLFVEAVRKLSICEHSLKTLVKRFGKDGILTGSEVQHSETAEVFRNSDTSADNAPGRIQIPSPTAETILRILKEDLENTQRSALKQAESCLNGATQNLVAVTKLLQSQLEKWDRSQGPILTQTNGTADDMLCKLDEKLVKIQNLSESLVRGMMDETRLSMLVKSTVKTEVEALVDNRYLSWKDLFALFFRVVVIYYVVRLVF